MRGDLRGGHEMKRQTYEASLGNNPLLGSGLSSSAENSGLPNR